MKYEVKNGWLLCQHVVVSRKQLEMGLDNLDEEYAPVALNLRAVKFFKPDDADPSQSIIYSKQGDLCLFIDVSFDELVTIVTENKF